MSLLPKAIYAKSNPYQYFNAIFKRSRKKNTKNSGTNKTLKLVYHKFNLKPAD